MNITPETTFEAVLDHGTTGLAGTIRLRTIDNDGATTQAPLATAITEVATGVYAAERISPDTEGLYTLVWDDGTTDGVLGVETLYVTHNADLPVGAPAGSYATIDEFVRRLRLDTPSAEALAAAQQALDAATQEINAHLSWLTDPPSLTTAQLALVSTVNLDRAAEHWRLTPYGALSSGPELPPILTARDGFFRHARKLASLKHSWGVA